MSLDSPRSPEPTTRAAAGSGATGWSSAPSAHSSVEWRCACLPLSSSGRLQTGQTMLEAPLAIALIGLAVARWSPEFGSE